jgi:hypothetical protein
LLAADGASYVAERNRALETMSVADVEARVAESRYTADTWKDDVVIDALHFWMVRRADAERAYALEGLRPEKYRLRRRPEPEAARELVRLNAAPIAFELLLKTESLYPLRHEKERVALEEAIVLALGASSHPAAGHGLMSIARDDRRRESTRELAVSQISDESQLVALIRNPVLGRGAVIGLGQVRTIGSMRALIDAARDPSLRLAAIRAIGSAASPFVLRRTKNVDADAIRSEAIAALEKMQAADSAERQAITETLAIVRGSRRR